MLLFNLGVNEPNFILSLIKNKINVILKNTKCFLVGHITNLYFRRLDISYLHK